MIRPALIALTALVASPALAEGDVANGEELVAKRCKSCHMIQDGDNVILKGGKTGPNLYGIVGRQAGTVDGFRYGDSLVAAGEAGLVWDQAELSAYLEDPRKYLQAKLDDSKAKSRMSFKLRKEDERADVAAYLATVSGGGS
ncbi:MAG: c-type cytochrome [Pseudomonadota bacterium]